MCCPRSRLLLRGLLGEPYNWNLENPSVKNASSDDKKTTQPAGSQQDNPQVLGRISFGTPVRSISSIFHSGRCRREGASSLWQATPRKPAREGAAINPDEAGCRDPRPDWLATAPLRSAVAPDLPDTRGLLSSAAGGRWLVSGSSLRWGGISVSRDELRAWGVQPSSFRVMAWFLPRLISCLQPYQRRQITTRYLHLLGSGAQGSRSSCTRVRVVCVAWGGPEYPRPGS